MHRAVVLLFAIVLTSLPLACGSSDSSASAAPDHRLDGRTYVVKVPTGYDGSHPVPLVVAIPGYANDATGIETYFGFDSVADEHGFLVVYPDGTIDSSGRRFFNATDGCCNFYGSNVDDVGFIDALLDMMQAKYDVDTNRIYAVGHSNGGFMAYRLACDLSPRFAAIVSLEGAMWSDASKCRPSQPVSVLQIEGTADDTVSPDGGSALDGYAGHAYPSTQETMDDWKTFDATDATGTSDADPGLIESDVTDPATVTKWTGASADVELWMIPGGVHSPTLTSVFPEAVYGFLSAHARGAPR